MRKHGLKSASKRDRLLAEAEEQAEEALTEQVMGLSHRHPCTCTVHALALIIPHCRFFTASPCCWPWHLSIWAEEVSICAHTSLENLKAGCQGPVFNEPHIGALD